MVQIHTSVSEEYICSAVHDSVNTKERRKGMGVEFSKEEADRVLQMAAGDVGVSVEQCKEIILKIPFVEGVQSTIDEMLVTISILGKTVGAGIVPRIVDSTSIALNQIHNMHMEALEKENERLRDIINYLDENTAKEGAKAQA